MHIYVHITCYCIIACCVIVRRSTFVASTAGARTPPAATSRPTLSYRACSADTSARTIVISFVVVTSSSSSSRSRSRSRSSSSSSSSSSSCNISIIIVTLVISIIITRPTSRARSGRTSSTAPSWATSAPGAAAEKNARARKDLQAH